MDRVALINCDNYERDRVEKAVHRAFLLLGGIDAWIKPGMCVLVKPNLMRKSAPELCAVTHPEVIRAVVREVEAAGGRAVVADSPGGAYNPSVLKGIYAATGLESALRDTHAELNLDCAEQKVQFPQAEKLREFPVIQPLVQADFVINVCKLKSHTLAVYSGAVKNLYGIIPGFVKAEFHFRFQEERDFSNMMVDLCEYAAPGLNLVDAIWGMEGEGPGSGDPRKLGFLVASQSPYAADICAAGMVGYDIDEIPMLAEARRRGLAEPEFALVGDDPALLKVEDFKRASRESTSILRRRVPRLLVKPLERYLGLRPRILPKRCIRCGICARSCPVHTIEIGKKFAKIHASSCIRCFCCMEFCPEKAIRAQHSWVVAMVMALTGGKKE